MKKEEKKIKLHLMGEEFYPKPKNREELREYCRQTIYDLHQAIRRHLDQQSGSNN